MMIRDCCEVHPLDRDTWLLRESWGPVSVYMYLLVGGEKALLIDSGCFNSPVREIVGSLTSLPVTVACTHGHIDHISAGAQFDEVLLHPADEEVFALHGSEVFRREYILGLLAEMGKSPEEADTEEAAPLINRWCRLPLRDNRRPLREGTVLDLGGRHVRVLETPGHTRGSVCLLDTEKRWLFTGDTVCEQGVLLHFPHSAPPEVFRESILKIKGLSSAFDRMYPGHHQYPLSHEILDRYLALADLATAEHKGVIVRSAAGEAEIIQAGGLSLSLPVQTT